MAVSHSLDLQLRAEASSVRRPESFGHGDPLRDGTPAFLRSPYQHQHQPGCDALLVVHKDGAKEPRHGSAPRRERQSALRHRLKFLSQFSGAIASPQTRTCFCVGCPARRASDCGFKANVAARTWEGSQQPACEGQQCGARVSTIGRNQKLAGARQG